MKYPNTAATPSSGKDQTAKEIYRDPKRPNIFSSFFDFLTNSIAPLLPVMLGAGLVKVLLSLLTAFGLLTESDPTYTVLHVISDALYYFFPILLAYTIAKHQGSSQPLAIVVAATLLHPDLSALLAGGGATFLTLPIRGAEYPFSILPTLLIVPLMKQLEKLAERLSPSSVRVFLKPLIVLLLTVPFTLLIIGPIGAIIGDYLADGIAYLYSKTDWLALLLLSTLMPILILTGLHYALIPLAAEYWTETGCDPLLIVSLFSANLALGFSALAVTLRTKDKTMRQTALGAAISSIAGGVPEPALFGVMIKQKRQLAVTCIASGVGGLYAGLSKLVAYTFGGAPCAFTLIRMSNSQAPENFWNGMITLVIVAVLSFGLTLLIYKRPATDQRADLRSPSEVGTIASPAASEEPATPPLSFSSPLSGKVIPLSEVQDPTFSSGIMGQGCAILPREGKVYAPCNGTVSTVADTCHTITIDSEDGAELLIHIGKDTAMLSGKHFDLCCKAGDRVNEGDLLLSFDAEAIRAEGYDLTTPLLVINADRFDDLSLTCESKVNAGDRLLTLTPKP